jgi:hypothetical protein
LNAEDGRRKAELGRKTEVRKQKDNRLFGLQIKNPLTIQSLPGGIMFPLVLFFIAEYCMEAAASMPNARIAMAINNSINEKPLEFP